MEGSKVMLIKEEVQALFDSPSSSHRWENGLGVHIDGKHEICCNLQ